MRTTIVWPGSPAEWRELEAAIKHNCTCVYSEAGTELRRCGAHHLLDDQRTLNGLLFARCIRARLLAEEQLVGSAT
jgi:hypothetical protein